MDEIQGAWKRIGAWYSKNVPHEHFRLLKGATEADVRAVESELNVRLPVDVRRSYRLHDGSGEKAVFAYGFYLLSLDEITALWKVRRDLAENLKYDEIPASPEGPIGKRWWDVNWVPFTHNSGGDHHCIDLAPDAGGTVGQVIAYSHEVGPRRVLAGSLTIWLSEFAESLENGQYRFDEYELSLLPA